MNFSKAIKELEEVKLSLINDHNSQIASIDDTIKTLQMRGKLQGTSNGGMKDDYKVDWKTSKKIAFFFNIENRFMHNREIAEMAHKMEPETPIEDFIDKFSSVLSRLKRDGHLTNIQIGKSFRNTLWGKPEWLDEERNPKEGHEFNKEYLWDNEKNTSLFL